MTLLSATDFRSTIKRKADEVGSIREAVVTMKDDVVACADRALVEGALVDIFPSANLQRAIGRMCRCRGMIQEVNPELTLLPVSRRDPFPLGPVAAASKSPPHDDEGGDEELLDAVLLYVIPVPGNTHFYELPDRVETAARQDNPTPYQHVLGTAHRHCDSPGAALPRHATKRSASDTIPEEEEEAVHTRGGGVRTESDEAAAAAGVAAGASFVDGAAHPPVSAEHYLNHPHLATTPGLQTSCIVTVLLPDEESARSTLLRDGLCTNSVIDFFGFLHFPDDQTDPGQLDEDEFAQFSSWHAAELTRGLVSRMLCFAYRPVFHPRVQLPPRSYFSDARAESLAYLRRELCAGDALLAEYVLLHLCARVAAHSAVSPVGDVPLLVCAPGIAPREWSAVLHRIVPVAEILLTRSLLDAAGDRVHPKQDVKRNFLQSGLLQLGNGTHVTVDCRGLGGTAAAKEEEGEAEVGTRAAQASASTGQWEESLFAVVHKQLLPLDYPFQTVELAVDLAFLALAPITHRERAPATFNFPLRVNWEPVAQNDTSHSALRATDTAGGERDSATAAAVRAYLEAVRRVGISFGDADGGDEDEDEDADAVRAGITAALLSLSEECEGWNNRDPLIHNNTFSAVTALIRAISASHGRGSVSRDDIAAAVHLERQRAARLFPSTR